METTIDKFEPTEKKTGGLLIFTIIIAALCFFLKLGLEFSGFKVGVLFILLFSLGCIIGCKFKKWKQRRNLNH